MDHGMAASQVGSHQDMQMIRHASMNACPSSWQLPIQQQPTVVKAARCLGGRRRRALGKERRRWLIHKLSYFQWKLHRVRLLLLLLLLCLLLLCLLLLCLLCLHQQLAVCPQPLAGGLICQRHCGLGLLSL